MTTTSSSESAPGQQSDLFAELDIGTVLQAYIDMDSDGASNATMYEAIADKHGIPRDTLTERTPIGKSGQMHGIFQRKVRWYQQSLRRLGMLHRMDRGRWGLTPGAKDKLTPAPRKTVLVAFSTDLGLALWANAEDVFEHLDTPIDLALMSPPYPLAHARKYGNVPEAGYVDWLCAVLEPLIKRLGPGASLAINLSNDIFQKGLPSRSLYLEILTLALHQRFSLQLMDRLIWSNPSKPPSPVQWASKERCQLNAGYEPVLWFTNDPLKVRSDNQRCLLPHTERQRKLITKGGEQRVASFSDGAHTLRMGSFGNETAGRIQRNVLTIGHRDLDQEPARRWARDRGLPVHGAPMPLKLAETLIQFLTREGDLVADPFGGLATTGKAAEHLKRRWLITERYREYAAAAAERFTRCPGFMAHQP